MPPHEAEPLGEHLQADESARHELSVGRFARTAWIAAALHAACTEPDHKSDMTPPDDTDTVFMDTDTDAPVDTDVLPGGLAEPPAPALDLHYQVHALPDALGVIAGGNSYDLPPTSLLSMDVNGDRNPELIALNGTLDGAIHPVFSWTDGRLVSVGGLQNFMGPDISAETWDRSFGFAGASDIDQDGDADLLTHLGVFRNEQGRFIRFESIPVPCNGAPVAKSLWAMNLDGDAELEIIAPGPQRCEELASTLYVLDRNADQWTVRHDFFTDSLHEPDDHAFTVDPYALFRYGGSFFTAGRTAYDGIATEDLNGYHTGVFRADPSDPFHFRLDRDPLPADAAFRRVVNFDQMMADVLGVGGSMDQMAGLSQADIPALLEQYGLHFDDYVRYESFGLTQAEPMGISVDKNGRVIISTTSEVGNAVFTVDPGGLLKDQTIAAGFAKIYSGGDGTILNPGWYHTPWGNLSVGPYVIFNEGWDAGDYVNMTEGGDDMGPQLPEVYVDSGYIQGADGLFRVAPDHSTESRYVRASDAVLPADLTPRSGYGMCVTDLEGDGDPDLLMGTSWAPLGGSPYILEAVGDEAHWISVTLNLADPDAMIHWTLNDGPSTETYESPFLHYSSPGVLCTPAFFIHVPEGSSVDRVWVTYGETSGATLEHPATATSYSL